MTRKEAAELYEAIKHGDADHMDWLKEAIMNFADGKPIPPPRGKGTEKTA